MSSDNITVSSSSDSFRRELLEHSVIFTMNDVFICKYISINIDKRTDEITQLSLCDLAMVYCTYM